MATNNNDLAGTQQLQLEGRAHVGAARTPFGRSLRVGGLYLVALVALLITSLPYIYMVLQSLAPWDEVNVLFFPTKLTIRSYTWLLTGGEFSTPQPWFRDLGNSVLVAVADTFAQVAVAVVAGFALALLAFAGRKRISDFILFHMFYPAIILLVPTFLVVRNIGLYNTYGGMIVPLLVNVWAIFMYTNFFRTMPQELIDAARIDGAGNLRILWSVLLPMSGPMSSVIILFLFMDRWIVLLWDLIIIKNPMKQTLNVLLATMFGPYGAYPGPLFAASVILTLPILILFVIFSRRFVSGIQFTVK